MSMTMLVVLYLYLLGIVFINIDDLEAITTGDRCVVDQDMARPLILGIARINNDIMLKWIGPDGYPRPISMYQVRYRCGHQNAAVYDQFSHCKDVDTSNDGVISAIRLYDIIDDEITVCVFQVQGILPQPRTSNSSCGVIYIHSYHQGPCVNVSTPCPDSAEGPQFLSTFCNERRSSTIPGPDQMPVTEFWPYANVSQNDVPYLHSENTDICFDGTANYTNIQYVIERCNYILQSLCPLCGGNQLLFRGRIVPQVTNCKIVPSQCQTAVVSISQQAEQDNCIKGGIIFTYLIDNVTVPENGETFIPCEFNYTKSSLYVNQPLPFWRIQPGDSNKPSSQVFIGYLPQDHQYNGSGLKIYNVDRSMNQTKYACCFDIFALRDICEAKSTIIIIKGIQPGKSTSTLQTWRLDLSILLLIALVTVL